MRPRAFIVVLVVKFHNYIVGEKGHGVNLRHGSGARVQEIVVVGDERGGRK